MREYSYLCIVYLGYFMKKSIILLFLILCGVTNVRAQSDTLRNTNVEISGEWEIRHIKPPKKKDFNSFFNNLTLPLEFGCAFTPKKEETRPGFYTRTSLEYRSHKTTGWAVAGEFDAYTRRYEKEYLNEVNSTKGRDWTIELLVGGGYRIPLVRNIKEYMSRIEYDNVWSLGLMLYAGASCQTLEHVIPAGTDNQGEVIYHIKTIDAWVPTAKLTASIEYCICYGVSIYATLGYLQHLQKTPLESDFVGELIGSLGITCFFR